MSLIKRIIPCLDFFNGRIVKGINFNNLFDIGAAVDVASYYNDEGADEIIFLDISATLEKRSQILYYINKINAKINIPLTVGGGLKNIYDIKNVLDSGADKVSLNSSLIKNHNIITEIKNIYGSQCLIGALDVKRNFSKNFEFLYWNVFINSGKSLLKINIMDIITKFTKLGIGEFLITSIDKDGTKLGYDLELFNKISFLTSVSIIASGGAGNLENIVNILKVFNIDAILIASILHEKLYSIFYIKNFLFNNGIYIKL